MNDLIELLVDFKPEDLVVDLRHKALIIDTLAHRLPRPVAVTSSQDEPSLNLALLQLNGLDRCAGEIHKRHGAEMEKLKHDPRPGHRSLDAVLFALRTHFAREFDGWVPPLGKHRRLTGIIGFHHSKPMGGMLQPAPAHEYLMTSATQAGRGVRVGVLDTKLFPHEALTGHYRATVSNLYSAGSASGAVRPWDGHGTFVTGLITAQAPAAEVVYRAVLNQDGAASAWELATEMARLASAGIDVMNLSLGCRTADGLPPLVLQRAVEVVGRDVLIVAAVGNHGNVAAADPTATPSGHAPPTPTSPVYPAALPGVAAVGAMGTKEDPDELTAITPKVPWMTYIAPGFGVVSTYLHGSVTGVERPFAGYARWSGSSFAAATTSGAVAAAMVPGQLTARGALAQLCKSGNGVVRPYVWRHDGGHAG